MEFKEIELTENNKDSFIFNIPWEIINMAGCSIVVLMSLVLVSNSPHPFNINRFSVFVYCSCWIICTYCCFDIVLKLWIIYIRIWSGFLEIKSGDKIRHWKLFHLKNCLKMRKKYITSFWNFFLMGKGACFGRTVICTLFITNA